MALIGKISTNRNLHVKVNNMSGVLTPSTTGITLGNFTAGIVARLDTLLDVVEGNPNNGDTLIYNSSDDKYYVQTLTNLTSNNVSNLDGGTF